MIKEYLTIIKNYYQVISEDKAKLRTFYLGYFSNIIISLIIPVIVSWITITITKENYKETLVLIFLLFVTSILTPIISKFNMHRYANFFEKNYITLHRKVIKALCWSDAENEYASGKVLNILTLDIVGIGEMADNILTVILHILKCFIIFIYFVNLNFLLALMIIIVDIIYLKFSNYYTIETAKYEQKQRSENDKILSLINQTIVSKKDIRTLNIYADLTKKFNNIFTSWGKAYRTKRNYYIKRVTDMKMVLVTVKALIYGICLLYIMSNTITLQTLLLVISYYTEFFSASEEFTTALNNLSVANVSLLRIKDLINLPITTETANLKLKETSGCLKLQNISFSYNGKVILKNITSTIEPNKITAIIGSNGSGKTTLLDLILKINKPDSGNIYLDDLDIWDINTNNYLKHITVLNQETYLFNLSIRANFNLVTKDTQKQEEICKLVGVDKLIKKLPAGYNTVISEQVSNISGGEKRLLSFARTLLKDSKILIFDEITASLDEDITKQVINVLKQLKKNHTIIIVTHKKELLKQADNIIRIKK